MVQRVNGETVPTKPVFVPSYGEVERAKIDETPVSLMIAFYDGSGTERTGFFEITKIYELEYGRDGGFSFRGLIKRVDMLVGDYTGPDDIGIVMSIDTGWARVSVDSSGMSIDFSITMRFDFV